MKNRTRINVVLTEPYLDALDHLVEEGIFMDSQMAIREALRLLFRLHRIEPFCSELVEEAEKVED